jgi:hypothetical protein
MLKLAIRFFQKEKKIKGEIHFPRVYPTTYSSRLLGSTNELLYSLLRKFAYAEEKSRASQSIHQNSYVSSLQSFSGVTRV